MSAPVSPSALVAWRLLVALGVGDDPERAREALVLWCRPAPALSVSDIREVMAAVTAGAEPSDAYDRDHGHGHEQGTGRPWTGARYADVTDPSEDPARWGL